MTVNTVDTTAETTHHGSQPTMILFIFGSCAVGAFTRTVFKKVPLPYTVLLLLFGGLFGVLASRVDEVASYTSIIDLDPHVILHVFLPVLIFESAYAMDVHTFLKSGVSMVILAIPGFLFAAFLTGVFSKYAFDYPGWTWPISLMFGAIISATDPVAVVALLKEVGASKSLGVLIEGESLLNDGAAIVVFNVCAKMAVEGGMPAQEILLYFLRVTLGGPLFGFVMAKLTIFWLVNIYNDALTEITITLASTYITFYVGEEFLEVSGVLAVVALGITLNLERTSISPEVEKFLHRFWDMLAYLANTLIFVIVGVVITTTATSSSQLNDWALMLALYCAITVIRPFTICLFSPILVKVGYGLKWRDGVVMSWGGLRGAVGLALALIVQRDQFDGAVKNQILIHTAGIVTMTLLVNGTTIGKLLQILGMREISAPMRMAMAGAIRTLRDVRQHSLNIYKHDRFLADADWLTVQSCVKIKDPYKTLDEEAEMEYLAELHENCGADCDECNAKALAIEDVPQVKNEDLIKQMRNEARLRLLKAQRTSFVRQFAHGMLSREAVRKLNECVDSALDTEDGLIDLKDVKKTWQIRGFYASLKARLEKWRSEKPSWELVPPPENPCLLGCYKMVMHNAFEITIQVVIIVNVALLIWEFVADAKLCTDRFEEIYGNTFFIINLIFIIIYTLEAVFKILGLRPLAYIKSNWNKFDFLILVVSIIDIILDQTMFKNASTSAKGCVDDTGTESLAFSPTFLRVARIVRPLRMLRSLRLVRGLIPQFIAVLNKQINKQIRYGYDVGKGYIMAEEEVMDFITHLIDDNDIRIEIKSRITNDRLVILKELGMLQKDHPGIAVSVKSQQAARRVLNNIRQKIEEMAGEGVLDAGESAKLDKVVETQMKRLVKIPSVIPPPPPEMVLRNLEWANEDPELMQYLNQHATLENMMDGETIMKAGEMGTGIYIIISGLVRIESHMEDNTIQDNLLTDPEYIRDVTTRTSEALANLSELRMPMSTTIMGQDPEKGGKGEELGEEAHVVDYLSSGSILGEIALLTESPRNATVRCASSVELYHISFDVIRPAMALDTRVPSLEYRLWRVCAIRIAINVFRNHFAYKRWTLDRLKMYLERSVLYMHKQEEDEDFEAPPFEVNAMFMADVVLVHGIVTCGNDPQKLVGPCYINNTVRTINLLLSPVHVILVVPRGNLKMLPASLTPGKSRLGPSDSKSNQLCLKHASLRRVSLASTVSHTRALNKSSSTLLKVGSSKISLTKSKSRSKTKLSRRSPLISKSASKTSTKKEKQTKQAVNGDFTVVDIQGSAQSEKAEVSQDTRVQKPLVPQLPKIKKTVKAEVTVPLIEVSVEDPAKDLPSTSAPPIPKPRAKPEPAPTIASTAQEKRESSDLSSQDKAPKVPSPIPVPKQDPLPDRVEDPETPN